MSGGLSVKLDASAIERLGNLIGAAGAKAPLAISRAINHTGDKAKTRMTRALAPQTGLKPTVIRKALKVSKASPGDLAYVIRAKGGDIRLKYFGARETRAGVSAAPRGQRDIFPGTFMKAGFWPSRVVKSNWNGQVFERVGTKTNSGMDRFQVVRSGVYIPEEMVKGASAEAFNAAVESDLATRLAHELLQVIGGR